MYERGVPTVLDKPNGKFCLFTYWFNRRAEIPRLAAAAKWALAVNATSVASESFFSITGVLHSVRRRKMKGETLRDLAFADQNVEYADIDALRQSDIQKADMEYRAQYPLLIYRHNLTANRPPVAAQGSFAPG